MITKKEDLDKCKLRVGDKAHEIHAKLKELGFSDLTRYYDMFLKATELYFLDGNWTKTNNDLEFFKEHAYKEITVEELLDNKDMEEYKVDKQFILEAHKAACSDWKKKLEGKFPDLFPKTYKMGDRFIRTLTGEEHILSRVGENTMSLICLSNGNSWSVPVNVGDVTRITKSELDQITTSSEWTLKFKLKE